MAEITARRDGHSKLVWNKDRQERETMDPHPETAHPNRSPIPTSEHNPKQPLSELKIIVHPEIPQDELWVHPAMFDLLQRALLEADSDRGVVCYGY